MKDKKIFILGMARSGYEAAKVLAQENEVVVVDAKEQNMEHVKELENVNVKVIITEKQEEQLDESFDFVIKNPGIRLDNPCVIKANSLNIKVINEVELAAMLLPKVTIIGITGSNGKTTTTSLIYQILKEAQLPVHLGGNIGYPVCSLINKVKENDILVLEISNLQLCNVDTFKTNVSVLTNLTPTHLDFHGTYENYIQMKKRIFNHHINSDLAILNLENPDVLKITEDILSQKQYFSSKRKADCYLFNDQIYYKNEVIVDTKDIVLKGNHNYENIMCAIMVCKNWNVDNKIIKKVLATFYGVEHRLEFVGKIAGVYYYNDSKATNPISTHIAVSSFKTPVILIMGGMDRKENFEILKDDLAYVKHIICYGETKNKIKDFANQYHVSCHVLNTLQEATILATDLAEINDTILLSPACASWDQFDNFEIRGKVYKEIIERLGKTYDSNKKY